MNTPTNSDEVRKIIDRASISNNITLLIGGATCFIIGLLAWFFHAAYSKEISGLDIFLYQILSFVIFGVTGLKNVPLMSRGVILIFGSIRFRDDFENGQKSILGDGWHWLPFGIVGAQIIDMQERSIKLPDTKFVVPDPKNKSRSGITASFDGVQINFRIFNPFAVLETGESDIDDELIAVGLETIRDYANTVEAPEKIFDAKVNDGILNNLRQEADSGRWGITVLSAKTGNIKFGSPKSEEDFEKRFQEERQYEAEKIQKQTLTEIAKSLQEEFELTSEQSLTIAQRISGLLRPSDIYVNNTGDSGSNNNVAAVAMLSSLIPALVKAIKSEENTKSKKEPK